MSYNYNKAIIEILKTAALVLVTVDAILYNICSSRNVCCLLLSCHPVFSSVIPSLSRRRRTEGSEGDSFFIVSPIPSGAKP